MVKVGIDRLKMWQLLPVPRLEWGLRQLLALRQVQAPRQVLALRRVLAPRQVLELLRVLAQLQLESPSCSFRHRRPVELGQCWLLLLWQLLRPSPPLLLHVEPRKDMEIVRGLAEVLN
jgi:hypothetical protein